MDSRFKQCEEEGKLVKIGVQQDLVKKELDAAVLDLKSALEYAEDLFHRALAKM